MQQWQALRGMNHRHRAFKQSAACLPAADASRQEVVSVLSSHTAVMRPDAYAHTQHNTHRRASPHAQRTI
jgi:hypothetical protein